MKQSGFKEVCSMAEKPSFYLMQSGKATSECLVKRSAKVE